MSEAHKNPSKETREKMRVAFTNRTDDATQKAIEYCKGKSTTERRKKVVCIETGRVFESIYEASLQTKVTRNNISANCNGRLKTAGGYHWAFVQA